MKLYPFDDALTGAMEMMERGATFYQQFNCSFCGAKQTMGVPNKFFIEGICEECGNITDIKKDGCNYTVHFTIG